jgi:hypothetical protein
MPGDEWPNRVVHQDDIRRAEKCIKACPHGFLPPGTPRHHRGHFRNARAGYEPLRPLQIRPRHDNDYRPDLPHPRKDAQRADQDRRSSERKELLRRPSTQPRAPPSSGDDHADVRTFSCQSIQ